MSLKHITTGLFAFAAILPVLAAPAQASTALPQGAPVVVIGAEGGFVPPGYIKSAMPSLVAYPNGAVLLQRDAQRRPDIREMRRYEISAARLRSLAAAVAKAAVAPAGGWGSPGVADVPNTYVRISYPGMKRDISVYALSFTNGGDVTPTQAATRKKLHSAIDALTRAVKAKPAHAWTPATYEAWTMSPLVKSGGVGMANPASVFCESMGGTLSIVNETNGQVGYCTLPDGTKTEEWAYFRATSPKFSQWPAKVAAPTSSCTVVRTSAFAAAFKGSNETARWLLPSGQAPVFTFRPVLPGENACKRG